MAAKKVKEDYITTHWRQGAAVVYLVICLFDFMIAPIWNGVSRESARELALAVKDLNSEVAVAIVNSAVTWEPLTLMGGGTFHMAFGAILGVAAWSRGKEALEEMRRGSWEPEEGVDDPDRGSEGHPRTRRK